ncbi:MAG: ribonuclease Y [bacterium]
MGILSSLLKKPKKPISQAVLVSPEDLKRTQKEAQLIVAKARSEADSIFESARKAQGNADKLREELVRKEEFLSQKFDALQAEQGALMKQKEEAAAIKQEAEKIRAKQTETLQKIASMTKAEAGDQLLKNLEKDLENDVARKIKEAEEEIRVKSEEKARQILVDAMQSVKVDYVPQNTTSRVKLPEEEIKGRIIGRDGRNIKTLEKATGVDFDLDEFPGEIRVSSFDGVRREIAKVALERLIADGRFQPVKIEEIVEKTRKDIEILIRQTGEKFAYKAGVTGLPLEIIDLLGRFKYRTSYGQNLIDHTLEIVALCEHMARDLGADVKLSKTAGLLHDLGKVLVEDMEGPHAQLTRQVLEKHKFNEKLINAAAAHHEEEEFKSIEAAIVHIADAISGARPGARVENYAAYYKRLRELEDTAKAFEGVRDVYAISAGRELRVVVEPGKISDAQAVKLSHDIAKKVEATQTYPGVVKVTVLRELRASELAK